MKTPAVVACYSVVLVLIPLTAAGQYVEVVTDDVWIRIAPSETSTAVVAALPGDTFEVEAKLDGWYEIGMFSGEYRYIQAKFVKEIAAVPELPTSASARRSACLDLVRTQDRADELAESRYPTDLDKQIDFQRRLYDRLELPVFRQHGIAPPRNSSLIMECAKNKWFP